MMSAPYMKSVSMPLTGHDPLTLLAILIPASSLVTELKLKSFIPSSLLRLSLNKSECRSLCELNICPSNWCE